MQNCEDIFIKEAEHRLALWLSDNQEVIYNLVDNILK